MTPDPSTDRSSTTGTTSDSDGGRSTLTRRALLAASVAGITGVAGCQGLLSDGSTRERYDVPARTLSPTADGTRTDSLENAEVQNSATGDGLMVPDGLARALTVGEGRRLVLSPGGTTGLLSDTTMVAGFRGPATTDRPPRLWIGLENEGERRAYRLGWFPPFSGVEGVSQSDGATGLYLLPPSSAGIGECWRGDVSMNALPPNAERTSFVLWPNDALASEYVLLRPTDAEGCVPERGLYRFADDVLGVDLVVAAVDETPPFSLASEFDTKMPGLPVTDETDWFHETGGRRTPVFRPERERVTLAPRATVGGALWNGSTGRLAASPGDWRLYKYHDWSWHKIAPWTPTDGGVLSPGERQRLRVTLRRSPTRTGWNGDPTVVGGIGPGRYALSYGFGPRDPPSGPVHFGTASRGRANPWRASETRTFAALVDVDADPVSVTPVESVDGKTREGATAIVRVGASRGRRRPALVVRRAEDPDDDAVSLITEQILQAPLLRTGLATLLSDPDLLVARVVTTTYSIGAVVRNFGRAAGRLGNFGPDAGRFEFEYRGERYRAFIDGDP